MAFLFLNLYDTPGLAPRMNVLCFEGGILYISKLYTGRKSVHPVGDRGLGCERKRNS